MRFTAGLLAWLALVGTGGAVRAADAPVVATLPSLALNPQPEPSPWRGLHVGSEVYAAGGRGLATGVGGSAFLGYDRAFGNEWVLGLEARTGYAPSLWKLSAARGYEFAEADLKAGYPLGRFTPFVTAGLGFARPNLRASGYSGATNAATDLFNDPGTLVTVGRLGGGVNYRITNDVSVEVAVSAGRGRGAVLP